MRWIFAFGFTVFGITFAHAEGVTCPDAPAHIVVESGSYSSQPGVTFALHHFAATLVPLGRTAPMCLQKMTDVTHADIFVSNESLTRIFAKKLGASDSKIRNLQIEHGLGKATLSGEVVKVIPVKFSISGPVTTDGTMLSMNATSIVADGIPVKPLLNLVGEKLSSMLSFQGVGGVTVEGNVLSFSPEKIAHLKGYIMSVDTTPEGLTLHYRRRPRAALAGAPKT